MLAFATRLWLLRYSNGLIEWGWLLRYSNGLIEWANQFSLATGIGWKQ